MRESFHLFTSINRHHSNSRSIFIIFKKTSNFSSHNSLAQSFVKASSFFKFSRQVSSRYLSTSCQSIVLDNQVKSSIPWSVHPATTQDRHVKSTSSPTCPSLLLLIDHSSLIRQASSNASHSLLKLHLKLIRHQNFYQ
jgi:hypothetical protein